MKSSNYLDITLDLNNGTYKSYRKPSCEILHVQGKSNQPTDILKQLPISIETKLSILYNSPRIFNEASDKKVVNQSNYDYKFQWKPEYNKKTSKSQKKKEKRKKSFSFNLPLSTNVFNSTGKYFFFLIKKIFPATISIKYSTK